MIAVVFQRHPGDVVWDLADGHVGHVGGEGLADLAEAALHGVDFRDGECIVEQGLLVPQAASDGIFHALQQVIHLWWIVRALGTQGAEHHPNTTEAAK